MAELFEDATCKEFLQVQQEGNREVKRKSKYYALSADYDKMIALQNSLIKEIESK